MQPRAASVPPATTSSAFSDFAPPVQVASALRIAITAAHLRPEPACLPPLLAAARCPDEQMARTRARQLTGVLRARRPGGVEALLRAYSLARDEGVALMCLAEALLRIPDAQTRDALVRDKIAGGDWRSHLGRDQPLFVNAATWALMLTDRIIGRGPEELDVASPTENASHRQARTRMSSTRPRFGGAIDDRGLGAALDRLLARAGALVVRAGINLAMQLLGEQFVAGPTITTALKRSAAREQRGYRHSYDMLGEAAMTADDAARYFRAYESAIHAVGAAARGAGCVRGPSISVKLSALHPRYCRAQADRVMTELAPRLKALAVAARSHDIGLTIDAEEADRLELSLDLFERLRLDPELAGWSGLGFVVQAYGKRAPYVIDWLVDLAHRSGERIMVRLVKGAYWDTEIKRAQTAGLSDFPVFTRKIYTDVSWLACARRLLDAGDAVYPQFATHNARSVAAILAMASGRSVDAYEFQCLFGMGEPLYDQLLAGKCAPCRIYAPVGPHGALLAYLVRRLLENGANTSFVRQAAEPGASIDALIADPVATVAAMDNPGAPHAAISAPDALFAPQRRNSAGMDLASEADLAALKQGLEASTARQWRSRPSTVAPHVATREERVIVNPGDYRDLVGAAWDMIPDSAGAVVAAARAWSDTSASQRAACLERAADALEAAATQLAGLLMREAGKTAASALAEVREAVDYLRYYGAQARALPADAPAPLGTLVCISPWNFPLAIFIGQIAAALAAGNAVIAKPSGETPLIAAEAVRILHEAGAPRSVLQLAPGDGSVGAALAAAPEVAGVLFTGSIEVAQKLNRQLAARTCSREGDAPLLIAETGGVNCMIVDSSALTEQVVADVLASAFDSAGQRCSALRVLCLQEEIADRTLEMLRGAMDELSIGCTNRLAIDIGPVINADARHGLEAHILRLSDAGRRVHRIALPDEARHGSFVAPAMIEIASLADVPGEAFGPVLHVLRWRRSRLDALVDAINDRGFGLTFGLHTRLDATIDRVASRIRAGNIYVNRNMIGAVVGSQPFGGRGLSGTGPKAGGPLMLQALMAAPATPVAAPATAATGVCSPAVEAFAAWQDAQGDGLAAAMTRRMAQSAPTLRREVLPGPVGEANSLHIAPTGTILLAPVTQAGLYSMIAAALATGNRAVILTSNTKLTPDLPQALPPDVAARLSWCCDITEISAIGAALLEGTPTRLAELRQRLAARDGAIVPTHSATPEAIAARTDLWRLDRLLDETAMSINTAAAGGNPGLLTLDADATPIGEGAPTLHKTTSSL